LKKNNDNLAKRNKILTKEELKNMNPKINLENLNKKEVIYS